MRHLRRVTGVLSDEKAATRNGEVSVKTAPQRGAFTSRIPIRTVVREVYINDHAYLVLSCGHVYTMRDRKPMKQRECPYCHCSAFYEHLPNAHREVPSVTRVPEEGESDVLSEDG